MLARTRHLVHSRFMSTAAQPGITDPANYCRDFVKKHDYEGFLVSHAYPTQQKENYYALKAFSIELAMIQDTTSNAFIGTMRMQFWRDAVKQIAEGQPPRHPIALALFDASNRAKLSPYHLKRMIHARDEELSTPTHLTIDSLTAHAESTSSTLLYLLLSLFPPAPATPDLSHAASHLGSAQTIATLLRGLPFHASKGRMIIPAEITAKHGVSQEDVLRHGGSAQNIEEAVFEFATLANDHLITAREVFKGSDEKVPEVVMSVFLAAVPVRHFLKRLEDVNFDAFHPSLQLQNWKLPWLLSRGLSGRTF